MTDKLSAYITLTQDQLLEKVNSTREGLSNTQAQQRLKQFGYNEVEKLHKRSLIVESLIRSINPLVVILLISALVSSLTGDASSGIIIASIVLLSITIDYVQSHRSFLAIERLRIQVAHTATAFRDKAWNELLTRELVPGDIIQLSAGDMVPADSILLTAKDLHVQQAALTGESLPIEKEICPDGAKTQNPFEATHVVFSGSSVVSGKATAIVITTGLNTEFGQIAQDLTKHAPPTEFEHGIVRFGLFISKTIMFLVLFVFLICIYLKRDLLESLLFAVALAVGLTPEFLPMITTVTLATGAVRMSKLKVIVKNLASIQNFGSIDILCSDKTGTLTTGIMSLSQYLDVEGKSSERTLLYAYLNSLYQTEITQPINDAILQHVNLNPIDVAVLKHEHPDINPYHKIDEIPFDFERRCSSVVVEQQGLRILISKGAPESILQLCVSYDSHGQSLSLDQAIKNKCISLYQSLNSKGYRLLAIGYRQLPQQEAYHVNDEINLTLSGFLVFSDPIQPEVANVVKDLAAAGVSMKILTGDNELVAATICQQVGISTEQILLGEQIENLTLHELMLRTDNCQLFARVNPGQKQRIIAALRQRGHVVGYMGDGINDAPSLHTADVGISVAGAVDVAKESANIILLENNLRVLLNGILEGRKAFGNIMKYLMMGTSSNFGNMFSMAGAVVFLPFLPMLPMQILLNNLLYDVSQLSIPTDKVDDTFIRKPRHWDIDIIRKFMLYIGPISSLFDFLTFYVMIKIFSASETLFHTGWFVESLATQTLVIFVIRTAGSPFKNLPSLPLFISVIAIVLIGTFLPFSGLGPLLGFVPLPVNYFIFLVLATGIYLALVQVIKKQLMWRWI